MASTLRSWFDSFRGFSRDANLLLLAGAAVWVPIGFLAVAVPVYMKRLGFEEVFIGTVLTTIGAVSVLTVIPFGIVADRVGRRRLMLVGGALASLSFAILALASGAGEFLLAAVVGGFAEALFFSTWNALLTDATTPERRTSIFGLSFFLGQIGWGVGAGLSFAPDFLLARGASLDVYRPFLGIVAAIALLSPFALADVRLREHRRDRGDRSVLESKGIITKFLAANLIIGLGAGLIVPLFALWFFLKFGLGESFSGPLFALSAVFNAVGYLVAPKVSERLGFVRTIVWVQVAATVLLFLIPLTGNLLAVAALFIARQALMNATWPVSSSFLMGVVRPGERAAASAVTGAAFRLPFAISTTLGAYLLTVNVDLPFFVTTGLYAVGTLVFWLFFRNVAVARASAARPAMP